MRGVVFVCLFVVGLTARISGSSHYDLVERFSESSYLTNQAINCIVQDTTGFLWIGTQHGLNKYDGSTVTTYLFDSKDTTTIGDNYVQALFVDSEGVLWVLVPQYFCRYDESCDVFIRYAYAEDKKNTHTSNPGDIVEDNRGVIWVGTPEMGLFSFDKKANRFTSYPDIRDNISKMYFDGNETLWIGSVGLIHRLNIHQGDFSTLMFPAYEPVVRMDFDSNRIYTRNFIYPFTPLAVETGSKAQRASEMFHIQEITDMLEAEQVCWIGSKGEGVVVYDTEQQKRALLNSYRFTIFVEKKYGLSKMW